MDIITGYTAIFLHLFMTLTNFLNTVMPYILGALAVGTVFGLVKRLYYKWLLYNWVP